MERIGLKDAQELVSKAMAKASTEFGRPICVAVVDAYGFTIAFARGDGAPVRSIRISEGKAYTAARLGTGTDAFLERLRREGIEASYFCDDGLTALPGGAVLKSPSGQILGGIGVSGLTAGEDQIVAGAAADLVARGAL